MSNSAEKSDSGSAGWGLGTKILVGIIAIIVVVAVLAVVTLTIAVIDSQTGTSFPSARPTGSASLTANPSPSALPRSLS